MEDELAFLKRRLEQERALSARSKDREARVAHARLADHYQARIDALIIPVASIH